MVKNCVTKFKKVINRRIYSPDPFFPLIILLGFGFAPSAEKRTRESEFSLKRFNLIVYLNLGR